MDAVGLRSGTRAVSERYRVAVVGGGIAGCAAAWALRRGGVRVTLYEKKGKRMTFWAPSKRQLTCSIYSSYWRERKYA